jgi:hypothetical protein
MANHHSSSGKIQSSVQLSFQLSICSFTTVCQITGRRYQGLKIPFVAVEHWVNAQPMVRELKFSDSEISFDLLSKLDLFLTFLSVLARPLLYGILTEMLIALLAQLIHQKDLLYHRGE